MVRLRRFTGSEWRDLARGLRGLVKMDDEAIERNVRSTVLPQFEKTKRLHEEMIELCELYAKRADERGEH